MSVIALRSRNILNKAGMISCVLHLMILLFWWIDETAQKVAAESSLADLDTTRYQVDLHYYKPSNVTDMAQEKSISKDAQQIESDELRIDQLMSKKQAVEAFNEVATVPIKRLDTKSIDVETAHEDQTVALDDSRLTESKNLPATETVTLLNQLQEPSAGEQVLKQIASVEHLEASERDKLLSEYMRVLQHWIAEHQRYPRKARLKKYEGKVMISFSIDRQGLRETKITESSSHLSLDKAAIETFEQAQIPMPPDELLDGRLVFSLPILYALK